MRSIVITGSTRGIGYGLADAFLTRGCQVTVSGRSRDSVDAAVALLRTNHEISLINGYACDVTQPAQVDALWQAATARFGQVDIWINNAGVSHDYRAMWELAEDAVQNVVNTNLLGTIHGCRTAIHGMRKQGHGAIYTMQGFGSGGNVRFGLSVYAASKAGVHSLTRSLIAETKDQPILIGSLSPGMVVTDLLLEPVHDDPQGEQQVKRITNILGERVETVAPWLVDRILDNDRHGAEIVYLTRRKILWRFLTAPFRKRDLFTD